mgnify:CR=1 FL=1
MKLSVRTYTAKILVLLALWALQIPSWARPSAANANQAIALFLYNFANYVEWPESAFSSARDTLNMCVIGNAKFVPYLDTFEGTMIRKRKLSIVKLPVINLNKRCHVIFLDEEEKKTIENIQVIHQSDFVLSFSDDKQFVQDGGVVSVFVQERGVQFEVNLAQALANGLYLSSDVLGLARSVKR